MVKRLPRGPASRQRGAVPARRAALHDARNLRRVAEQAYSARCAGGRRETSPFHDRALYMQGLVALQARPPRRRAEVRSSAVLDLKIGRPGRRQRRWRALRGSEPGRPRARRRHLSVSPASAWPTCRAQRIDRALHGHAGATQLRSGASTSSSAELYIKQERSKDAAPTPIATLRATQSAQHRRRHRRCRLASSRSTSAAASSTLALRGEESSTSPPTAGRATTGAPTAKAGRSAQPLVKNRSRASWQRHYHASGAADGATAPPTYQEAVRWYRRVCSPAFPERRGLPRRANFLLAESALRGPPLSPRRRPSTRRSAYAYPEARRSSADAAYAGLLKPDAQAAEDGAGRPSRPACSARASPAALRFAQRLPGRSFASRPVLADAAEKLYALKRSTSRRQSSPSASINLQATGRRRRSAGSPGPCSPTPRSTAAPTTSPRRPTPKCMKLMPATRTRAAPTSSSGRPRRSTSRASRRARPASQRAAAASFARVAARSAPSLERSRAAAQYDAAATLIGAQGLGRAPSATLEDFRKRYPSHPLQAEATKKLALAYLEKGNEWAERRRRIRTASPPPARTPKV